MGSSENTVAVRLSQEVQGIQRCLGCGMLNTFDAYCPWSQSEPAWEEVFRLREDYGVEDLNFIEQPIAVQGRGSLNSRPSPQTEVERCAE